MMMGSVSNIALSLLSTTLLLPYILTCNGFTFSPMHLQQHQFRTTHPALMTKRTVMSATAATKKATLTDETTWTIRFVMNNIPTKNGKKIDQLFVMNMQFLEDEGYEPPQGNVKQLISAKEEEPQEEEEGEEGASVRTGRLDVSSGRWQLSEDPEDRKDGLWVWGLFKEPLYPFMLLTLETDEIQLPGEMKDSIAPLKLFAQIRHTRDDEAGAVLDVAELNIREIETIKADPFGSAVVNLYEDTGIGQISFNAQV